MPYLYILMISHPIQRLISNVLIEGKIDFGRSPVLRSAEFDQQVYTMKDITKELSVLSVNGWVTGKGPLSLTAEGKAQLTKSYRRSTRMRHREH